MGKVKQILDVLTFELKEVFDMFRFMITDIDKLKITNK